jgi:hypothetical protein
MISLTEYSLFISTGEHINISEFDPDLFSDIWNPSIEAAVKPVIDLCTIVSRPIVEMAKMGYDTELKSLLRSPIGALLRLNKSVCAQIKTCPMADIKTCTTKNVSAKAGLFPICWEYYIEDHNASSIINAIVHAWRQNRYVFFITP